MKVERLAVEGALAFVAEAYPDDRGLFTSPFQDTSFRKATGHALFPVAQASFSVSRRGVVRGLHYSATPPGIAKFVHCSAGRALDIVLDVRVGSPTFGVWDGVDLGGGAFRGVYLPVGVAHMFVVGEDGTIMNYLLSGEYVARNELAISPADPRLGLPIPERPLMSERDRAAPTLAEAEAAGHLPEYGTCAVLERQIADGNKWLGP